jgi:transcriptional regulator with XRE-family HTH domain
MGMDFQALGQEVVNLRKKEKLSQQQLASDVGLSRVTINAIENTQLGDVGIRKLIKVLDYFGCELTIKTKSPFPVFEELIDEL